MKKAVIKQELSLLIDESPMTIGEILYSIIVGAKAKTLTSIQYLDHDDIARAIEHERKAVNDPPLSDTDFENWVENKFKEKEQ